MGFWVIRTPILDAITPKKSRSNPTYMETGSFPIIGSCQLKQLMNFCLFPARLYNMGQDLPFKIALAY